MMRWGSAGANMVLAWDPDGCSCHRRQIVRPDAAGIARDAAEHRPRRCMRFGYLASSRGAQEVKQLRVGGRVPARRAVPGPGRCPPATPRCRLSVDLDLGEGVGIVERFQNPCPALRREVHVADGPVTEQEPEHMVTEHGNTNHGRKILLAHGPQSSRYSRAAHIPLQRPQPSSCRPGHTIYLRMTAHDTATPIQSLYGSGGRRLADPVQLEIQTAIHLAAVGPLRRR